MQFGKSMCNFFYFLIVEQKVELHPIAVAQERFFFSIFYLFFLSFIF